MKSILKILLLLVLASQGVFSVLAYSNPPGHYWVSFSDKDGTPYSIKQPQEFLSARSVERRTRQGITINTTDLPPNPQYVNTLKRIENLQVFYTSRWLNGVLVFAETGLEIQDVVDLPFVSEVELVKPFNGKQGNFNSQNKFAVIDENPEFKIAAKHNNLSGTNLGLMAPTIQQVNGQYLIDNGLLGQGMMIAVLDAGFTNVDQLGAFEHLRLEGRIKGTRDFVDQEQNIYQSHGHGTVVLSVMAALAQGQLFGTATGADYWLVRTEDGASEFRIEEYNWLAGAELADSAGVDIINSSLGYSEFDAEWQNYTYHQMDGVTTVVARAANLAKQKGMVVVASAGNSGQTSWFHIISPSDALGTISIGAVNTQGERAGFSSVGPSADGRIKPDVMAHGWGVPVITTSGTIGMTSGTSLSSPVISGLVAALWQKFPQATALQVIDAIKTSSSRFSDPDYYFGYGIPDFFVAAKILRSIVNPTSPGEIGFFPNPFSNQANIVFSSNETGTANLEIFNQSGQKIRHFSGISVNSGSNIIPIFGLTDLENGLYIVRVTTSSGVVFSAKKVMKLGR